MKKIAIPIWNGCVSSVFDFAESVRMVTLDDKGTTVCGDIALTGSGDLERSNQLISAEPDVLLCGAISHPLADRISMAGIEVVSLVCGPVDQVIEAYRSGDLARPEFRLPGCKEGSGRCARKRHGRCGRHK